MCSIAGAFFFKDLDSFDASKLTVEKIIQKTASRGPDFQGVFSDKKARVIFGHARLAIVDCQARSNQPFRSKDGRLLIVFNGEIYNYLALRKQLQDLGYEFVTTSDTEVLLYAFDQWGLDLCLEKLDGIFAFAVFDFITKTLWLARDRFGVKPLFFSIGPTGIYFSSNARALLFWPEVSPEFSAQGVWHYLSLMAFPAPFTAFENVYCMPAGYYAVIGSSGEVVFSRWYKLEEKIWAMARDCQSMDYAQAICISEAMIEKAIDKRLAEEVHSGIFLSGGLDSSLIAAIASRSKDRFLEQKIHSFNLSFDFDQSNSEKYWAELVANKFGLVHISKRVCEREFKQAFGSMSVSIDLPVSDPVNIPFFILSSLAKAQGLKVVFVGEGADELFGGYSWYFKLARVERMLKMFTPKFASNILSKVSGAMGSRYLAQVFKRHSLGQELFWTSANLFDEQDKLGLLDAYGRSGSMAKLTKDHGLEDFFNRLFVQKPCLNNSVINKILPGFEQALSTGTLVEHFTSPIKHVFGKVDPLLKYSYIDFILRIPNLLMSRVDQMSMAHSLEVREPFLDTHLVEFVLGLPTKIRLKNLEKKPILKSILRKYFPDSFINRKKIGFATPIDRLF